MLIRFIDWLIHPLGYHVVPKNAIVVVVDLPRFDADLAQKIIQVIDEHHQKPIADNVVRLDKYV